MGTKYRVDRVDSMRVPCGMNSIRYVGDSWEMARRTFNLIDTGKDAWGQDNPAYGVVLSVWDNDERDYVIKCVKGL